MKLWNPCSSCNAKESEGEKRKRERGKGGERVSEKIGKDALGFALAHSGAPSAFAKKKRKRKSHFNAAVYYRAKVKKKVQKVPPAKAAQATDASCRIREICKS